MSCRSCNLDLKNATFLKCVQCIVPSIELCLLCFSGGYHSNTHSKDHSYTVVHGENLKQLTVNAVNGGTCLSLIDECRKLSVGAWATMDIRATTGSPEECENAFMHFYEQWSNPNRSTFPEMSFDTDESALEIFAENDPEGMFFPTCLHPAETADIPGFLQKRSDFDMELDDSAELIIADLEISDDDATDDIGIKLECLRAYCSRIIRREACKAFTITHDLVNYHSQVIANHNRPSEEVEMRGKLRPLQRYFSAPKDFERFVQLIVMEQRIESRIKVITGDFMRGFQPKDMNMSDEKDTETNRHSTRSKLGSEGRRSGRMAEDGCTRVRDVLASPSWRDSQAQLFSTEELDLLSNIGIPGDVFATLRDSMLSLSNAGNFESARIRVSRYGETFNFSIQA